MWIVQSESWLWAERACNSLCDITVSLNLAETWLLATALWERTMCWRSAILGCPDRRTMASTPHQDWNRSRSSGLHRKHWTMVEHPWCLCCRWLKLILPLKWSLYKHNRSELVAMNLYGSRLMFDMLFKPQGDTAQRVMCGVMGSSCGKHLA